MGYFTDWRLWLAFILIMLAVAVKAYRGANEWP